MDLLLLYSSTILLQLSSNGDFPLRVMKCSRSSLAALRVAVFVVLFLSLTTWIRFSKASSREFLHHRHHHRHHHRAITVPSPLPVSGDIDSRYGVEKRLIHTGPNPLHNWKDNWSWHQLVDSPWFISTCMQSRFGRQFIFSCSFFPRFTMCVLGISMSSSCERNYNGGCKLEVKLSTFFNHYALKVDDGS